MHINFNTNQLQQNHTNFKSKLPSVNATYNIDKVYAKFIPDYWQEFARDSLSITHYCRDKAIAEIICNMIKSGFTIEKIIEVTGKPVSEIEQYLQ